MSREVSGRRLAIAAAAVVAGYVLILSIDWRIPDRVVGMLGGPTGVDRWGGVTAKLRTAAGETTDVAIAEVSEPAVQDTLDYLAGGGLQFRAVRTSRDAYGLATDRDLVADLEARFGVDVDFESWRPEDGGPPRTDSFLRAATRQALEAALADGRERGVLRLAADTAIGFERIESMREPGKEYWRTYQIETAVEVDGSMVANAVGSYDPNTNRPVVLLDLDRDGAERFAALTTRIVGDKLAMVVNGRVYTAPMINGPIRAGRASIMMGGNDVNRAEASRTALVSLLHEPPRPESTIVDWHWQPPGHASREEWLARLGFALIAGLAAAVLAFAVVRIARPRWRTPPPVETGGFPWKRLAVTLLAPLAMFVLPMLTLPGINDIELQHVVTKSHNWYDSTTFSIIAIGVVPLFSAFTLVELIALTVPRLRWRRHDPRGRIALGRATAIVAIVIALVQAYFVAVYLESISTGPRELIRMFGEAPEVVDSPGLAFRLVIIISLGGGTALLAVIAGMIREHGLGNGYGALLASGSIVVLLERLGDDPAIIMYGYVGIAAIVVIALTTVCVLRWRIAGADDQPEMRVPSSGLEVLGPLGGLGYLLAVLSAIGLGYALADIGLVLAEFGARPWVPYVSLVVFVPIWAWLLARPSLVERVALQAGIRPPSRCQWARGAFVTLVVFAVAMVVGIYAHRSSTIAGWVVGSVAGTMLGTAVILDIIDDARARRTKLSPAGVVHQIQYLGVIERVLADASIPCHIHAGNLRTLLAYFGPWAPAIVLVPEAHAKAARDKIDGVLRAATAKVPEARIRVPD